MRLAILGLIGLGSSAPQAGASSPGGLCLSAADPVEIGEPAQEKTGTISGTCVHPTVKKFPTLVYIDTMPGKEFKASGKPILMDQKNKEFNPRVLPVLVGSTVD